MAAGATDIYFYDHDGNHVLILQDYTYFEYTQRLNDSWNYVLRMEMGEQDDRLSFFRETLVRDFILEVYRTDPINGERTLVWEGFHRTLVDQVKANGTIVLTLYGVGYTELLKRRIILPPAGSETSDKSGPAETVIKEYVDESCVNPTDATRTVPGLSIYPDGAHGDTAAYSARYTILYTAVKRVSEQGGLDFTITRVGDVGTFELQVENIGTDRSVDNTDGNDPIIFDVRAGNMLIPIFSLNGGDEINFVYIGGQGEGVERTIQTMSDATAIAASPWNRREDFVDARNEATQDGLLTRGQSVLNERGFARTITFNIEQTPAVRWPRDWGLGDTVTPRYFNQEFSKRIIEITVTVTGGRTGQAKIEEISPEMVEV